MFIYVIVGVIYRPPETNVKQFNEELDNWTDIMSKKGKNCILIRDMNINLKNESNTIQYTDALTSNGFHACLLDHSTVTRESKTLIDLIFSNIDKAYCASGVCDIEISDDKSISCVLHNADV